MKALSLTQPWATLIAIGAKQIETRNWSTAYRGWLAIHASKTWSDELAALCIDDTFARVLVGAGITHTLDLPRGAIVAVGNLHKVGEILRRRDGAVMVRGQELPITGDELDFGDYTAGRYGWVMTNVHPLPEPVPCRGALGLWGVPFDVERQIRRQLPWLTQTT